MKRSYIYSCFVLLALASCKKFVEVDPPVDKLTSEQVFANEESAVAAMRGIYSEVMKNNNYIGNGALSVFPGLSSDEITRTSSSSNEDPFVNNSIPTNSSILSTNLWQKAYFHIYQSNSIIEKLQQSNDVPEATRKQLTGEAKFFRAFFHFNLVNLFGPVPLVLTTDYHVNAVLPRTETEKVWEQVTQDLVEAKSLLTEAYPTPEKVRVNKFAVQALLSRVYLCRHEWEKAEAEATAVINSGVYQLSNISSVFSPNNTEAILQVIPSITQIFNTSEAFSFIPATATSRPTYVATNYLINAFEANDLRKINWLKTVSVSNVAYTYPYKYKVRSGTAGAPKSEYNIVLRLAEQYLIRAEARAQQNKITEGKEDLNVIRKRAGLSNTSATDKQTLLQAIEKEKQVEYFAEWGHRWFDLKRWGMADAILSAVKGTNWQATDSLYPIPQSEILSNPSLVQNPGY